MHIEKIRSFGNKEEADKIIKELVEMTDNFGNTPLALACIYDYESKRE